LGLITYVKSFFKPVIKQANKKISLVIRGILFEGKTNEDILSQVNNYINHLRRRLYNDFYDAAFMKSAGNLHGKWNLGIVMMNNTRKTLEALESFYEKNSL